MNNKRYQLIIDIINIMLGFLIAFSIMGFVLLIISGDTKYVWKALYLVPAPFLSCLIGKRAKYLWTFSTLHILMISAYFLFVNDILLYIIFGAYLLVLSVITFAQRIKIISITGNTPIGFIAAVVITYLYCDYIKLADMKLVFFVIAIFFALLYFINLYLLNFKNYFIKHEDMANIPFRQIVNSNHMLFFFFGLLCFAAMLLFSVFPLKDILLFLGRLIMTGIRALVSLFHFRIKEDTVETPDTNSDMQLPPMLPDASPIIEIIAKIIAYGLVLVFTGFIIVRIIYGIYNLYKKFYSEKTNALKDKLEFISPFEKKKKLKREDRKSIRKMFRAIFGRTNNEKIRKYYYSAIVTNTHSDQLSKEMTPMQLTRFAIVKDSKISETVADEEKEKELTALYEKARYSREECSKNDLLKVKKLIN